MHDSERLEFLGKKNNYTGLGVVWCNDAITCVVHGEYDYVVSSFFNLCSVWCLLQVTLC